MPDPRPSTGSRRRSRLSTTPLSLALTLALALGLLGLVELPKAAAATCTSGSPCTVFGSAAPTTGPDADTVGTELGMKFRSDTPGAITGVRFYKSTGNTGTHSGSLWSSTGTRLATVNFSGETATGWQTALFGAPVTISANTTYVVSYFAPNGRYNADENFFASQATVNSPLTGLQNGTDGGNGVYRYGTTSAFPTSTYNATNYWVDALFTTSTADTTAPTVTSRTPAAGATGVATNSSVSATFSEPVQPATIVMTLKAGTTTIATTTAYDSTTRTATMTPNAALAASTTYTVNLSGTKDTAGNTMTAISWTFTTAAAAGTCPCTIFSPSATPATAAAADNSAVELGVKFRSSQAGYITGMKYYRGTGNDGPHTGSLWKGDGSAKLASVTFADDNATGWNTATFSGPVPIAANTTYVASYYAPVGRYAATSNGFASAISNGPLTGLANGTDGANGVYAYGASAFPDKTYQATNYWVDVIFNQTAVDTVAPTVTSQVPANGTSGNAVSTPISATFSEPVNSAAIEVRDSANALVAGSLTYDSGTQKATFSPSSVLAYSTTYTVAVSGAKDAANNTMTPVTWSFTTAAPPPPGPEQGPGGPIAVVTSTSNPYATFLAEILRTEGLNEFATIDVSTLSASTLANYDTVVLGAVPVTAAQASTLNTWVTSGGNLIALKPSSTLSSLAGITAASGTLSDAYLKIDTTTAPGAGIVADSIQFHSAADKYTANSGTQTVAALWSNATTATVNPAVTLRSVGTSGGQVATFTFDLAKSIALSRQGNIAWAGTERDGNGTIRSDDYYFGGSSTDWVNLSKVSIPQADELQRLLANTIQLVNRDKKPLPRFWYFPKNLKAVLVGTGDDHANNGTTGRFNQMIANSPSGCTAAQWTCYRYSSYLWNGTPLTNAAAANFTNQGFEVGLHVNTGGGNYTASSIYDIYAEQMAGFRSKYTTYPNPATTRMHAIVFSDWSSQPKAEIANGMRMDTNYYYWPGSWVQDRPGFMTGSGMAMRFTDTDGSLIDNYQAATQMTDESDQSYPNTLNTLVDNALNSKGFYGSFVANFHTDQATEPESDALISKATAAGVPIVSSQQLLTWLDGRNGSSYSNMSWASNKLNFKVNVGAGATNLTGMLPTAGPGGNTLSGLTKGGVALTYTTSTIKGLEYAVFSAGAGNYVATYSGGTAAASGGDTTVIDPPVSPLQLQRTVSTSSSSSTASKSIGAGAAKVSAAKSDEVASVLGIRTLTPPPTANAKTLRWTTKKNTTTQVLLGTSPSKLAPAFTLGGATRKHAATLTKLKSKTTYYYRVVSTDTTGTTAVTPAADQAPATFTTAAADTITPTVTDAPQVTALPDGTAIVTWETSEATSTAVRTGTSAANVTDPIVGDAPSTDHSVLLTDLDPGKTYYVATDSLDAAGNKVSTAPIKIITPGNGVAQSQAPSFTMGTVDGDVAISRKGLGGIALTPNKDGSVRATTGTFVSAPLDAMQMVDWDRAIWKTVLPKVAGKTVATGIDVKVSYRVGSTTSPKDGTWSAWTAVGKRDRVLGSGRFLQYKVKLTTDLTAVGMPSIAGIGFTHNGTKLVFEGETGKR